MKTITKTALLAGFVAVAAAFGAPANAAPQGSYTQTCRSIEDRDGNVYAECRTRRGTYERSQLSFRGCVGDLGNDDGKLFCLDTGGVRRYGMWYDNDRDHDRDGRWRDRRDNTRAVVYRDANYNGPSVALDRGIRNLKSIGFNDKISSIRIQGRGAWLVCDRSDYQGRCIRVNDVRNMRDLRMNDDISSMRPL